MEQEYNIYLAQVKEAKACVYDRLITLLQAQGITGILDRQIVNPIRSVENKGRSFINYNPAIVCALDSHRFELSPSFSNILELAVIIKVWQRVPKREYEAFFKYGRVKSDYSLYRQKSIQFKVVDFTTLITKIKKKIASSKTAEHNHNLHVATGGGHREVWY